ncbi:hypothetical protein SPRG_00173 [Saprolegnia parasitica CBS 223.65]|uniref:Uncharacterized protein n=1 Tax=Saprolegnia parasitica (strain CBS 223.65) TaxID=695850 RepID=A0A067CXA2_SAPPC|nr:hypothetical protein SPRG_00173 [Saprolegnia parasitica CBS 223.65]KDO35324.1 hypothetical protein SPRG_00173 [Saprolegnia parasitica CBS 223.65]|eukprot:XP_012193670.1 hypothetical protein SPRG_00173 [Saprolegnia parasitica CBS 223.65]
MVPSPAPKPSPSTVPSPSVTPSPTPTTTPPLTPTTTPPSTTLLSTTAPPPTTVVTLTPTSPPVTPRPTPATPAPTQRVVTSTPTIVYVDPTLGPTPIPSIAASSGADLQQYVVPAVVGGAVVIFILILLVLRKRRHEKRYDDMDIVSPYSMRPGTFLNEDGNPIPYKRGYTSFNASLRNTNVDSQLETRTTAYDFDVPETANSYHTNSNSIGSNANNISSSHQTTRGTQRSESAHSSSTEDDVAAMSGSRRGQHICLDRVVEYRRLTYDANRVTSPTSLHQVTEITI